MVGAHQNLNELLDLTTPLSGMICHPRASIYYDQPICQILSLYLHPLREYEITRAGCIAGGGGYTAGMGRSVSSVCLCLSAL